MDIQDFKDVEVKKAKAYEIGKNVDGLLIKLKSEITESDMERFRDYAKYAFPHLRVMIVNADFDLYTIMKRDAKPIKTSEQMLEIE